MATVIEDRLTETADAANVYTYIPIDACLFYKCNGKRFRRNGYVLI